MNNIAFKVPAGYLIDQSPGALGFWGYVDILNQKVDTTEFKVYENFNDFYHLDVPAITLDKTSIIEQSLNTINNTLSLLSKPSKNKFNIGTYPVKGFGS